MALGQLSAGLTHELNNPAAAAARATASLRERVAGMRHKLGLLGAGSLDGPSLAKLAELQESTVERVAKSARSTPMERSDREDELADVLDESGIAGSYDLAPVFAGAGLDAAWARELIASTEERLREPALRWLGYTVETESLMQEIEDATARISALLRSVRQYSQMDRTPFESVDVREGLESTLVVLGPKVNASPSSGTSPLTSRVSPATPASSTRSGPT